MLSSFVVLSNSMKFGPVLKTFVLCTCHQIEKENLYLSVKYIFHIRLSSLVNILVHDLYSIKTQSTFPAGSFTSGCRY